MKNKLEPEHWLEIGFILLGAGLLGVLTVVTAGWLSEAGWRQRKSREKPPEVGEVAPEKHQGILNVSIG
jgi:hypothetical protein